MESILIKGVLGEINTPNAVFEIEFRRKGDGFISKKTNVTKLSTKPKNEVSERRKMNRSGIVKLYQIDSEQDFELYIDFIIKFNGKKVIH